MLNSVDGKLLNFDHFWNSLALHLYLEFQRGSDVKINQINEIVTCINCKEKLFKQTIAEKINGAMQNGQQQKTLRSSFQ